MLIKKHPTLSLTMDNIDSLTPSTDVSNKRHSDLFPNTVRAIICGPSSCGKTNLMISLLLNENGLRFENVYIYSKSLYQAKYELLSSILKRIPEIGLYQYSNSEEVIDPDESKPNSVFIFDDVACDKQDKIQAFFCMGRHKGIDSLYLTQTYTRIPKHLLRDNCNVIVLFRQDHLNLHHVYLEHVSPDITYDTFKEMCQTCWNADKYNPLVIMKDFDINQGRYRMSFDKFIDPL